MVVKQIKAITEIDAASWNQWVQNDDPFVGHAFLAALEQSGCVSRKTGWEPAHLLVYEQQRLIAAMPLYLKFHSRGEYVFDHSWAAAYHPHCGQSYFPKWLNAVPFTPCLGQRLLIDPQADQQEVALACFNYINQCSAEQNISSLHCLFPNPQQAHNFPDFMQHRLGVQFQWFNHGYRDFNDFLQCFTSRQRKNIKKERRNIQQQGILLQRIEGPEVTQQQWEVFFRFYQITYLKHGQNAYLSIDFFKRIAAAIPQQILLVLAQKEQRYVGAALSFIGRDTLYGRYWGCYEEYNSLHFEACYYQGLEYCLQHQLSRFDSGAQGEHKISRGFEPIITHSAHWFHDKQFSYLIADFLQQENQWIQDYRQSCAKKLPFNSSTSF